MHCLADAVKAQVRRDQLHCVRDYTQSDRFQLGVLAAPVQTALAVPRDMPVCLMRFHNITVMFGFIMLPLEADNGRGHETVAGTKTK